jgi:hypothetical protein
MMGDYVGKKLDGVGAEPEESELFYFPFVRETDSTTTLICLVNRDEEQTRTVELRLYDQDRSVLQEYQWILAPSGSLMGTVTELFGEHSDLEEGYVKVSSDGPLAGFEVVTDETGLSAISGQSPSSSRQYLVPHFFVDSATSSTTVLRLLNTGGWRTTAVIRAIDDNSEEIGKWEIILSTRDLEVIDLRDLIGEDSEGLITGFLEIELRGYLGAGSSAVGSVTYSGNHGKTSTTLPLISGGQKETVFPQVAQTANGRIFTGLAILNPTEEPATILIETFDEDGYPTAERQLDLAPGTRVIDTLRSDTFLGMDFAQITGHLRVSSSTDVLPIAIFGDGKGEFLSTIEGQGAGEKYLFSAQRFE